MFLKFCFFPLLHYQCDQMHIVSYANQIMSLCNFELLIKTADGDLPNWKVCNIVCIVVCAYKRVHHLGQVWQPAWLFPSPTGSLAGWRWMLLKQQSRSAHHTQAWWPHQLAAANTYCQEVSSLCCQGYWSRCGRWTGPLRSSSSLRTVITNITDGINTQQCGQKK